MAYKTSDGDLCEIILLSPTSIWNACCTYLQYFCLKYTVHNQLHDTEPTKHRLYGYHCCLSCVSLFPQCRHAILLEHPRTEHTPLSVLRCCPQDGSAANQKKKQGYTYLHPFLMETIVFCLYKTHFLPNVDLDWSSSGQPPRSCGTMLACTVAQLDRKCSADSAF